MKLDRNLSPKTIALITGGSRGIGKSTALELAKRGIGVVLTYANAEEEAQQVIRQIADLGGKAVALRLNLSQTNTFDAFALEVRRQLEQVWSRRSFDFLVNNAGSGGYASFADTTEAVFDELLGVHFKGPFFLTQKLLPLIENGGRIVNLSTGLTRYTLPGLSVYASAKGALEVLTRSLAVELGSRQITVNAVAPGGIATDFGGGIMRDPALQKTVAAETPLGRIGEPKDIADIVLSLLREESRWITGQRIEATGGYRL